MAGTIVVDRIESDSSYTLSGPVGAPHESQLRQCHVVCISLAFSGLARARGTGV